MRHVEIEPAFLAYAVRIVILDEPGFFSLLPRDGEVGGTITSGMPSTVARALDFCRHQLTVDFNLGLPRSVMKLERASGNISVDTIAAIAKALKLDPATFLFSDKIPPATDHLLLTQPET